MTDAATTRWQSACDRYEVELDMAINACLDANPGASILTVILAPGDQLFVGTGPDMDTELRSSGERCVEIADYIRSTAEQPDGVVTVANVYVVVLDETEPPVVQAMPVYGPMSRGGSA